MRVIEATLTAEQASLVFQMLDQEGIDYHVVDESSGQDYSKIVTFPVPTNAVEPILDMLQEAGIPEESVTIVVGAETVVSEKYYDLKERYASESVEDQRISRQELHTRAEDLTPAFSIFLTMTIISAMVATAGLLLDSPAIVVGSMVIAPLIGPALATGVGSLINDRELYLQGIKFQILGVVAAIAGSAVFAWLLQSLVIVPPGVEIADIDELHARVAPGLLSLPVAIGAGIAGVLSLSTGISVALVGVMIAAALIPPAAAAGIAIAWGFPTAALGSTVLVVINLLSVNLAGLLTLWYLGYRPGTWFEHVDIRQRMVVQVAVLIVVTIAFTAFLVGVTYTNVQVAQLEETAHEESEAVLDEEYEEYHLIDTEVAMLGAELPFEHGPTLDATEGVDKIVIRVGSQTGEADPDLADRLHEEINAELEEDVDIEVRYIAVKWG